jgi:leader peptidase (prepilin peptidase)/N-methyltransferase
MWPASHCLGCNARIRFYDNVPLLSYFLLRGRCRACGARYSARYVLVEALGAVLALLCFHSFVTLGMGSPIERLATFFWTHGFAIGLLCIFFIDLRTMIIPDSITLILLILMAPASIALGRVTWQEAAIGAATGFVAVWLLRELWLRLRKVEGIGLGDAKLLGMVGGVLGWQALPAVVLLGSLVGLAVAVPLRLMGRSLVASQPYRGTAVREAGADPESERGEGGAGGGPGEASAGKEGESATEGEPLEFDEVPPGAVPFGPFLTLAAILVLYWGSGLNERLGGIMDGLLGL